MNTRTKYAIYSRAKDPETQKLFFKREEHTNQPPSISQAMKDFKKNPQDLNLDSRLVRFSASEKQLIIPFNVYLPAPKMIWEEEITLIISFARLP